MKPIFIIFLTVFSLTFATEANPTVKNNQWALNSREELGDINQDGVINILDIVILAGIILHTITADEAMAWAANLNEDEYIDMSCPPKLYQVLS